METNIQNRVSHVFFTHNLVNCPLRLCQEEPLVVDRDREVGEAQLVTLELPLSHCEAPLPRLVVTGAIDWPYLGIKYVI